MYWQVHYFLKCFILERGNFEILVVSHSQVKLLQGLKSVMCPGKSSFRIQKKNLVFPSCVMILSVKCHNMELHQFIRKVLSHFIGWFVGGGSCDSQVTVCVFTVAVVNKIVFVCGNKQDVVDHNMVATLSLVAECHTFQHLNLSNLKHASCANLLCLIIQKSASNMLKVQSETCDICMMQPSLLAFSALQFIFVKMYSFLVVLSQM